MALLWLSRCVRILTLRRVGGLLVPASVPQLYSVSAPENRVPGRGDERGSCNMGGVGTWAHEQGGGACLGVERGERTPVPYRLQTFLTVTIAFFSYTSRGGLGIGGKSHGKHKLVPTTCAKSLAWADMAVAKYSEVPASWVFVCAVLHAIHGDGLANCMVSTQSLSSYNSD
ncbi:uncharacterized protein EI90DRAFT_850890 [Cantharellus anzutake]|uniref:uncharacterized protein n=1 Tax=Cantharellus anzutake TaxID=1750568 RepID=UPI0019059DC6|nr:uncharacterized protein EI90DRAFT_850890 [Cantharellus anzutake]KAF8332357.1 hypothetical protein EI90DRAFT_850890 [Cantharellus anzutake]